MKFVIHIGAEKTGTTAVQAFLAENRRMLSEAGFLVPASLGEANHIPLTLMALDPERITPLHRLRHLYSPEDIADFTSDHTTAFAEELRGFSGTTVVLSNEHLSSKLHGDAIARFAGWISQFTDEVEILLYLRRQDLAHVSWYSTQVKIGGTEDFDWPDERTARQRYDYLSLIRGWEEHFPTATWAIRVFERDRLQGGRVETDLLSVLRLDPSAEWVFPPRANESLDVTRLAFLLEFNRHVPRYVDGRPNPLRGPVVTALTTHDGGSRTLQAAAEEARAFVERFAPGNETIARDLLGHPDGRLFDDVYPEGGPTRLPELTAEQAVAFAASLWTFQQDRVREQRTTITRLRQRVARLRGSRGS